jgi:tRNA A-37 threonylcarbamoyl transferase component Bud32
MPRKSKKRKCSHRYKKGTKVCKKKPGPKKGSTKRKKKTSKRRKSKKKSRCRTDQEINPKTGRCRKKCRTDQERNPKSGRCRKSYKSYKRPSFKDDMYYQSMKRPGINSIDYEFRRTHPNLLTDEFVVRQILKEDDEKQVLLVCYRNNCNYILKIIYGDKNKARNEVNMTQKFSDVGVGIDVYNTGMLDKGDDDYYVFIQKFEEDLKSYLTVRRSDIDLDDIILQIKNIINILCANNMIHGDLHWENIGYILNNRGKKVLKLIDFGWSIDNKKCKPVLEYLQLYSTLDRMSPELDYYNKEYIRQKLVDIIVNDYNYNLEDIISRDQFTDMHARYQLNEFSKVYS